MAIKQKKLFISETPTILKAVQGSVRAEKLRNPEDKPPFYIRGQKAKSKEEYWISLWAEIFEEKTGITWDYQVSVYGGRTRPNGNVVDFLFDTPGMKTMLEPMGKY